MFRLAVIGALALAVAQLGAQPAPTGPAEAVADVAAAHDSPEPMMVLVYSRTAGFRHTSIPDGIAALKEIGEAEGFEVVATEDPAQFTDNNLERFAVVVFLSTTGDVLDDEQEAAFERFIAKGRGYVGVHAAADTEYDWPWYGQLVGGYFKSHPKIQPADVVVEDRTHPSTAHLPERWRRTDEWYNYRENPRERESIRVLMHLDTESFQGSGMPGDHPIAWCHEFGGGRAWYTGGGHTSASFREPDFRKHLLGGVLWAAGRADGAEEDDWAAQETDGTVVR